MRKSSSWIRGYFPVSRSSLEDTPQSKRDLFGG
jgi:hypothetical protein